MSTFFNPPSAPALDSLVLISLGREHVPALLRDDTITNTRFGSYPHSTLVNVPWGSQVRASNVGSADLRKGRKRKRGGLGADGANADSGDEDSRSGFESARSGFAHLIPPTPESWTISLPHRTQVVYTPDYSYILQRLCVRPGSRIIEAGAGSGSFTHAAARAVFNGYTTDQSNNKARHGKVFSYEYHEPRFHALRLEIRAHGLDDVVRITHRDVYEDGFGLEDGEEINATAVFLDLPMPWVALSHLNGTNSKSPLDRKAPIHICCFSPCIEQATRTADTLRNLGYVSVAMMTIQHKVYLVRRERVSMNEEGLRGGSTAAGSVHEAVTRLREIEKLTMNHMTKREDKAHETAQNIREQGGREEDIPEFPSDVDHPTKDGPESRAFRRQRILQESKTRKFFLEGRVIHKIEPDMKTHTSFLVFAILTPEWTAEDEAKALATAE